MAEIDKEIPEIDKEIYLQCARGIRNQLLIKSDIYMLQDYPISQEQLIEIKAYRQSLRDFININKEKILNNEEVIFPQSPNFNI